MKITRISAGVALTAVAVLGGAATASASVTPAHYTSWDKAGCHAAWDIHKHGMSGVGIPDATVIADFQITEVWGSAPYKQDSRTMVYDMRDIPNGKWRKADKVLVAVCGSHH